MLRSKWMIAMGLGVASVAALWLLLFDHYRYFDFQPAHCSGARPGMVIELKGDFSQQEPTVRGAPYRLLVRIPAVDTPTVRGLRLASAQSSAAVDWPETIGLEDAYSDPSTKVYLSRPLAIPYEDYELKGTLGSEGGDRDFTCRLKKDYKQEWRAPLWDALLSV